MRACRDCGPQPAAAFGSHVSPRTGKRYTNTRCKACASLRVRAWAKAHPGFKRKYSNRDYFLAHPERLARKKETANAWRVANWLKLAVRAAGKRALAKGIAFDLTVDDLSVPEVCPVLGIRLAVLIGKGKGPGARDASPSLDRLEADRGYVRGNVAIISFRANAVKNHGTAEEHELVAVWMRKQHQQRNGELT